VVVNAYLDIPKKQSISKNNLLIGKSYIKFLEKLQTKELWYQRNWILKLHKSSNSNF